MPDEDKPGGFGLPSSLFTSSLTAVANIARNPPAGSPAPTRDAAIDVMISIASEENAALHPTNGPDILEVVMLVLAIKDELALLQKAPAAGLDAALRSFKGKVDDLKKYYGS
jgi:hypothetical protein